MAAQDRDKKPDSNRDPISGEPGAHPLGVGLGTVAGGAAAGTALGTAAGPVGTVAGAVIGGVVGGLAGKEVAESINPTAEDAYWEKHYSNRPYIESGTAYDEYRPAYRYGWESHGRFTGKKFEDVESDLKSGWDKAKAKSTLNWDKAREATRDAWDRIDRSLSGEASRKPR